MPGVGQSAMIYDTLEANIIGKLQQKIIYPSLVTPVTAPKGSSFIWPSVKNQLTAETITTGTEAKNATLEFNRNILELTEKGLVPKIWDNDVADARWDIVQTTLDEVGKAFARAMNSDFITAVASGVSSKTHAAGTAWTSTSSDILYDIKTAIDKSYAVEGEPNAILMNPQDYTSCLMNPDFLRATAQGDKALIEGAIDKVFGMSVFTSTAVTKGTVYGMNANESINFYEREAFSTEFRKAERERATNILCWARYGFAVVRNEHIFSITGVST